MFETFRQHVENARAYNLKSSEFREGLAMTLSSAANTLPDSISTSFTSAQRSIHDAIDFLDESVTSGRSKLAEMLDVQPISRRHTFNNDRRHALDRMRARYSLDKAKSADNQENQDSLAKDKIGNTANLNNRSNATGSSAAGTGVTKKQSITFGWKTRSTKVNEKKDIRQFSNRNKTNIGSIQADMYIGFDHRLPGYDPLSIPGILPLQMQSPPPKHRHVNGQQNKGGNAQTSQKQCDEKACSDLTGRESEKSPIYKTKRSHSIAVTSFPLKTKTLGQFSNLLALDTSCPEIAGDTTHPRTDSYHDTTHPSTDSDTTHPSTHSYHFDKVRQGSPDYSSTSNGHKVQGSHNQEQKVKTGDDSSFQKTAREQINDDVDVSADSSFSDAERPTPHPRRLNSTSLLVTDQSSLEYAVQKTILKLAAEQSINNEDVYGKLTFSLQYLFMKKQLKVRLVFLEKNLNSEGVNIDKMRRYYIEVCSPQTNDQCKKMLQSSKGAGVLKFNKKILIKSVNFDNLHLLTLRFRLFYKPSSWYGLKKVLVAETKVNLDQLDVINELTLSRNMAKVNKSV